MYMTEHPVYRLSFLNLRLLMAICKACTQFLELG